MKNNVDFKFEDGSKIYLHRFLRLTIDIIHSNVIFIIGNNIYYGKI